MLKQLLKLSVEVFCNAQSIEITNIRKKFTYKVNYISTKPWQINVIYAT